MSKMTKRIKSINLKHRLMFMSKEVFTIFVVGSYMVWTVYFFI